MTLLVRDDLRAATAHGRHQGMRRTQINAHRDPPLMWFGRLSRLSDLQECHAITFFFPHATGR